jgi:VWFA-related protein
MTTAGKPGVKGEFTTDRIKLKAEMKRIRQGYAQFESFLTPALCGKVIRRDPQALSLTTLIIDSEDRSSGSVQAPARTNTEAEAVSKCRMLLLETESRRRAVTSSIEAAIQKMSAMPGQHMIALFTEGFSMTASGGDPAISEIRPAISSAVVSGVMIYAFDAHVPMASKQANIESYSLSSEILNSSRDLQHGMSLLASETGGAAFYNLDGLSDQLRQMLGDNRICYRLSYYPPSGKDPRKYRRISVSVKGHPEYRVRAQKGYDLTNARSRKN